MPSKVQVWDFVKSNPETIPSGKEGVFGFSFPDIYSERIILDKIPSNLFGGKLHVIHSQDVTTEWLENTFNTLDLFAASDSYKIIEAQNLSNQVVKFLEENSLSVEGRALIFSFNKTSKTFDKLEKVTNGSFTKVEGPKFWETDKYFDFFMNSMGLKLTFPVKSYLLGSMEASGENYFNALNLLRLYQEERELSLDEVRKLFEVSKLDQFQLADFFCSKRFKPFFSRLISLGEDFEALRGVFSFMQGHLFKVLDPSYAEKKAKLSKYDKEILGMSKNWKKDDLLRAMQMFSEMEIMAKSKNRELLSLLSIKYFRSPK